MVRNSFKPRFVGRFATRNGQIVLTGSFGLSWFTKAFLSFWFGFCLLWTVGTTISVLVQPNTPATLPFAGAGMLLFGVILVTIGKTMARGDTDWLANQISAALQAHKY